MDLGLRDKSVLVLASSSGLGLGAAKEFAREGAKVMLFGRSEEALLRAQDEIRDETGNAPHFRVGDLMLANDVDAVVEATNGEFGSLYALVNNTGGPPAGRFESFDDDDWQAAFELTLLSYIRSMRAALPLMKRGGGGRILNNASSSTKQALDELLLSNVFRMGIVGLSKTLAREFASAGILVNVIGAGRIATPRIDELDAFHAKKAGVDKSAIRSQVEATIPLGRLGTVAEFGRLAVFLCSEANSYITGQTILVDGGVVTAY